MVSREGEGCRRHRAGPVEPFADESVDFCELGREAAATSDARRPVMETTDTLRPSRAPHATTGSVEAPFPLWREIRRV